ncbi:hypothetical protein WUBG_16849, partial [Wuchereria bancrofti]
MAAGATQEQCLITRMSINSSRKAVSKTKEFYRSEKHKSVTVVSSSSFRQSCT